MTKKERVVVHEKYGAEAQEVLDAFLCIIAALLPQLTTKQQWELFKLLSHIAPKGSRLPLALGMGISTFPEYRAALLAVQALPEVQAEQEQWRSERQERAAREGPWICPNCKKNREDK